VAEATYLIDGLEVAIVEFVNHFGDFFALGGQLDPHRPAVRARALLKDVAALNELLEIVGNVRAEIVPARTQLTGSQLCVTNVEHQQRLYGVDIIPTHPVE